VVVVFIWMQVASRSFQWLQVFAPPASKLNFSGTWPTWHARVPLKLRLPSHAHFHSKSESSRQGRQQAPHPLRNCQPFTEESREMSTFEPVVRSSPLGGFSSSLSQPGSYPLTGVTNSVF
jgi:hypothetical protein